MMERIDTQESVVSKEQDTINVVANTKSKLPQSADSNADPIINNEDGSAEGEDT